MPEIISSAELRELDHRVSDGIAVCRAGSSPAFQTVPLVAVREDKTGDAFTIEVGDDQRRSSVFQHVAVPPTRDAGAAADESSGGSGERTMTRILRRFRRVARRRYDTGIAVAFA